MNEKLFSPMPDAINSRAESVYEHIHKKIPSVRHIPHIRHKKAIDKLKELGYTFMFYQVFPDVSSPSFHIYDQPISHNYRVKGICEVHYYKKEDMMVRIRFGENHDSFTMMHTDVTVLEKEWPLFTSKDMIVPKKRDTTKFINILLTGAGGSLEVSPILLDKPNVNIMLNYGKDFYENKHPSIVEKLNERKPGIFLFYGSPGTGKTSYIKYLSKIIKRDFLFIPSSMIDRLTDPSMLSVFVRQRDMVLILEDAEQAVIKRDGSYHDSLVSTLLNMSDGIIGSLLNISILVTFNTNKEQIDPALVRKGRLKAEHDFQKLSMVDSQALADKLGKKFEVHEPMSLADIYNYEETNFHKDVETKPIGFLALK